MQTNYLGPYLLTEKLLPLLIKTGTPANPSRIISVGSVAQYTCPDFVFENINNLDSLNTYAEQYSISKFLGTVHVMSLAERLQDKPVVVHSVCPGFAITGLWRTFPPSGRSFAQFLRSLSMGKDVDAAAENVVLRTFPIMEIANDCCYIQRSGKMHRRVLVEYVKENSK